MKKKILTLIILILGICCLIGVNNIIVRTIIFIGMLFFLYAVVSCKKYQAYYRKKFPGTVTSTKRNYDCITLGKYRVEDDDNTLNLTGYRRNFYTDCLLAARYYSFLKTGGTIKIYMDPSNEYLQSEKISRYDITALHEVTLWEHGIDVHNDTYKLRLKWNGMLFLIGRNLLVAGKKNGELPESRMENLLAFGRERGLNIVFILPRFYERRQNEVSSIKGAVKYI